MSLCVARVLHGGKEHEQLGLQDRSIGKYVCFFERYFEKTLSFPLLCPQPVDNADFIIPVEIDGTVHQVGLQKEHADLCFWLYSHVYHSSTVRVRSRIIEKGFHRNFKRRRIPCGVAAVV